jgi:hypothetical protein
VVAGLVTLTGSALDSSGTGIEMVSLGLDYDNALATAPGATATATWDSTAAPDGSTHTLVARATDNAGGTRFASGTFTVQNSAATRDFSFALEQTSLTLSSSTPAVLGVTTAETIGFPQPLNIVGSADPWCLQVRGANLIAGQTAAVTVDASSCGASPVGTLTLTVTGLYASRSASIPVTVIDDTPPSFVSNSPPDGAILSGIATLTTIASDPGTPLVSRIAVDGIPVGQGAGYVQASYDSRQLPDGPHAISYEAVDASGNAASQTVHVTVLNAPASHDLALNGGFESLAPSGALIGWTAGGTKPPVRSANAHGGAWSLGLGTQPGGTSVASQLMWIPSQATSAALTLWARGTVAAGTTVATDWQEAAVYDRGGALLRSLAHQQITSGWTQLSADLAGYAGQVVEFRLTTQGGAGTSLWVDDVALIAAPDGVGGAAACLGGGNALYLDGTAGDWVHPGIETITAGPWYAYADPASGMVQIISAGSQYWGARLTRRPLEPGIGEGATRAAIASYGAGIDVSGNGRGFNQTSGRIQVIEAAVDAAGALRSFTATFEQSCETWLPLLRGCVHYQSAAASGREGELRAGLLR